MTVRDYQKQLKQLMTQAFSDDDMTIKMEYETNIGGSCYSPRLDMAVGPYAEGDERLIERYDDLTIKYNAYINRLAVLSNINNTRFPYSGTGFQCNNISQANYNARCFIGIEVENTVSQKHLLGGAINATSMGRIGILVAWNDTMLDKAFRMRRYLLFLKEVEKAKAYPENLFIVTPSQLLDSLNYTSV